MKYLIAFLFISFSAVGQEFNFDIHKMSLPEYVEMEEKLGSQRIPTSSNHVSFSGNAQPIKFLREEKNIPDLTAYYFFKKADSTMSYILYEWDVYNFEKQSNNQKSLEFQKALINKYKSLEDLITSKYGEANTIEGDLSNLQHISDRDGLKKKNIWIPNDSTGIEMYTAISNFHEKTGMVTRNPTHRIRLYIRNTKKEEPVKPKLNLGRLDSLQGVTMSFLGALKRNEIQQSKKYLSPLIIDQVTDEQLTMLSKSMDLDKELELFQSGVQVGLDGRVFTILQYKYKADPLNPSKEMVKLVFDEENKVLGIQPMVLMETSTD